MTTARIGIPVKRGPDYGALDGLVAGLRDDIARDVSSTIVASVSEAIARAFAGMNPVINVAPPAVRVEAPAVSVSPNINVDIPADDESGEINAIEAQTAVLGLISSQLATLITVLSTPVTKTVHRDSNNYINEVTESR